MLCRGSGLLKKKSKEIQSSSSNKFKDITEETDVLLGLTSPKKIETLLPANSIGSPDQTTSIKSFSSSSQATTRSATIVSDNNNSQVSSLEEALAYQYASLTQKIEDPARKIQDIANCFSKLNEFDYPTYCFICSNWYKEMRENLEKNRACLPIDNYGLIEKLILKKVTDDDYEVISKPIYIYLKCVFGGGPILEVEQKNAKYAYFVQEFRSTFIEKNKIDPKTFSIKNFKAQLISSSSSDIIELANYKNFENVFHIPNIGIENKNVDCYLNAVLQILLSIPNFVAEIMNKKNISKNMKYCQSMQSFITKYLGSKKIASNRSIKKILPKGFVGSEQDSHECLTVLLSTMQEELATISSSKKIAKVIDSEVKADEMMKLYYNTFVDNIFMGRYTATYKCKTCKKITSNYDLFYDFSLAINSSDLTKMISNYFKEENIHFTCEGCKKATIATKTLEIARLPEILVIQIKRFIYLPEKKKIHTSVNFDLDLNLSKYVSKKIQSSTKYSLIGGIEHHGECDSGHYFAVCKRNKKWWLFNDEKSCEINEKNIQDLDPYMLIYQRIQLFNSNGFPLVKLIFYFQ